MMRRRLGNRVGVASRLHAPLWRRTPMRAIRALAASRRSRPSYVEDSDTKQLRFIVDMLERELATLRHENSNLRAENAHLLRQQVDTLRNENGALKARIQKEDGGTSSLTLMQPVKEPAVEMDGDSDSDDAPKIDNKSEESSRRRRNYGPSLAGSAQALPQGSSRSSRCGTNSDAAAVDVPVQILAIISCGENPRPAFPTSRRGESSRCADDASSTPLFTSRRGESSRPGSFKKRSQDHSVSPMKEFFDVNNTANQSPCKQESAQLREEDNQAGTLTALSEALNTRNSGILL